MGAIIRKARELKNKAIAAARALERRVKAIALGKRNKESKGKEMAAKEKKAKERNHKERSKKAEQKAKEKSSKERTNKERVAKERKNKEARAKERASKERAHKRERKSKVQAERANKAREKVGKERAWKNVKVRKCTTRHSRRWANCTAHPISWYTNCKGGGAARVTWRRCGFMNAGGQYLCQRPYRHCVMVRRRL